MPSSTALDADDVAGETDQDRSEGGAPFAAGDLPDGGGGNPTGIVSNYSGKDWVAEIAHAAARLMLAGWQMREGKMAGGDALSAFGRKPVRNATEGRNRLSRSQQTGLGAQKTLGSTVKEDTMSVNEAEGPRWSRGTKSYGKCRLGWLISIMFIRSTKCWADAARVRLVMPVTRARAMIRLRRNSIATRQIPDPARDPGAPRRKRPLLQVALTGEQIRSTIGSREISAAKNGNGGTKWP